MPKIITVIFIAFILSGCATKKPIPKTDFLIANGQMPNIVKDNKGTLHLVYGSGDSLMYTFSSNFGNSFSSPSLIAVIPNLAASHTRGPQIASLNGSLVVITCNSAGNIFSFRKEGIKAWQPSNKVNDIDTTAKENLIALSGDNNIAYAVWLDVRANGKNKIYGSKSIDGGKTWLKNMMVYTSPDSTVCECCKPSVLVAGNNINVMFRNWINGNRDMYLIQSVDGGSSFKAVQKLGNDSWKLNGCPMDGGGLAINKNGEINTVWRRQEKIFTAIPGKPENQIGTGKGCTIETMNGENIYAWTEKSEVIILRPDGKKTIMGKGNSPIIKSLDDKNVLCIWENNKQIHGSVIEL